MIGNRPRPRLARAIVLLVVKRAGSEGLVPNMRIPPRPNATERADRPIDTTHILPPLGPRTCRQPAITLLFSRLTARR